MKRGMYLLVLLLMVSACTSQTEGDKHQNSRDKVIDIKSEIKEIDTGDVLIGNGADIALSHKYLIIYEHHAYDRAIHLFDKIKFQHITSTGIIGQGPDEITNMGTVLIDDPQHKIYVMDHGKQKILSYDIDSIIAMPDTYKHQTKATIGSKQFPSNPIYINDTLSYARIIIPTSSNTFDQMIGKWNMLTGEIKTIGEKHAEVRQKRSIMDVSIEKGIIVETYINHDLINIQDLDGNNQCYVYGPDWGRKGLQTFKDVMITPKHILACYSGEAWAKGRTEHIHVFDFKGNYIKTLHAGYSIKNCSYDPVHHRLYMVFDNDIQFGYLELKGII